MGIEPKSKLSPTVKGIARSIEKLFNQYIANDAVGYGYDRIEISEIWDPENFINQIKQSYMVVGFTVYFSRPNPFDVEADFHRPMERYLQATNGDKGKTTIQGTDLDRDEIENIARSVASTGNDVSARIRVDKGQRLVTKHLKGDPVEVTVEEEEKKDSSSLFEKIREVYSRIRNEKEK